MSTYKILKENEFRSGKFKLVPIRFEDRWKIMKWRNEQIYHLRQVNPLTETQQNSYFKNTVNKLFDQDRPSQLLFSFLENDVCIGYGGLVNINWNDLNSEISFLIDTNLEKSGFSTYWQTYLSLVENLAFQELNFHKVFVYAFDVRPHLYPVLESCGYFLDARLTEHHLSNNEYLDVVIYSKLMQIQ